MTSPTPFHRVAILTGGGDCPGLNAVIRAFTRTALTKYGWEVFGIKDGFDGFYDPDGIIQLDYKHVSGILQKGGTILGTSNRVDPFHFPVETPLGLRREDRSEEVLKRIEQLRIDVLVTVGGDGTQSIGLGFAEKGIQVVGVPKTIDNDLNATDVTFGFQSAVEVATDCIDRLHSTAESHHRVMVVELMGRDAGWIALQAGMAGGADIILLPEIPYELPFIVEKIRDRYSRGHKFSILVVAEGAESKEGGKVYQDSKITEPSYRRRLGGIGAQIAKEIEQTAKIETRFIVLGHIQRGGSPVAYDRILATRFGFAAAEAIAAGQFGTMVCLKGTEITTVSLEEAIGVNRKVPLDSDLIAAGRSLGISFGDQPILRGSDRLAERVASEERVVGN